MNIPIFLASDNNYAPYLSAVMVSIVENTTSQIAFYIIDGGISSDNLKKISSILEKYNNCSIELKKIDLEKEFSSIKHNVEHCRYLSLSTYSRFLISKLYPNLKKVIYLDTDIIANGDIKNLYDYDLSSYALGAIPGQILYMSDICKKLLGLSDEHKFFNAGVLLMDLEKLREQDIMKQFFKIEEEKRGRILCCDQDILNTYFDNNYLQIDKVFNYEAINDSICDNFVLRHYTTALKPWLVHPDLDTELVRDKNLFWYYLAKTSFYDEVLKKCKYTTVESLHKARLEKLIQKYPSKDAEKYLRGNK